MTREVDRRERIEAALAKYLTNQGKKRGRKWKDGKAKGVNGNEINSMGYGGAILPEAMPINRIGTSLGIKGSFPFKIFSN